MNIDLIKLRELREKAGLTRRDLADKIGCREHTIVRWENGENKKPLSLYRKELEKFFFGNVNEIKNTFKYLRFAL
jgi:DNA-binding XRE family transcriptional regulator